MRIWLGITLSLLLAVACGRTEEPPAPRTGEVIEAASVAPAESGHLSDTTASSDAAPAADSSPNGHGDTARSCVVRWSDTPAAPVQPAQICPKPSEAPAALRHGGVVFRDASGQPRVNVELALTPEQRSVGLMYRTALDAGSGMLFSWTDQEVRSFWMHNTCLPLDMLFIASDGIVSGILEQVPPMNELPRSVRCKVQHVLEVNAGWCRAHGVAPGQRVEFER